MSLSITVWRDSKFEIRVTSLKTLSDMFIILSFYMDLLIKGCWRSVMLKKVFNRS